MIVSTEPDLSEGIELHQWYCYKKNQRFRDGLLFQNKLEIEHYLHICRSFEKINTYSKRNASIGFNDAAFRAG